MGHGEQRGIDEAVRRCEPPGQKNRRHSERRILEKNRREVRKEGERTPQAKGGQVMRTENWLLSAVIACVGLVAGCIGGGDPPKEPRQFVFNDAMAETNSEIVESSDAAAVQS